MAVSLATWSMWSRYVIDCHAFGAADEGADHGEADDTAFGGHAPDGFVGFATGGAGDEGAAVGVGDDDGDGGGVDGIEGCPVAAVGDVDSHADGVHAGEDLLAELGETGVAGVGGGTEVFGVLQADQDSDFAGLFGEAEIGGGDDALELVRVCFHQRIPAVNVADGLGVDVAGNEANGGVEDCRAGVLETLEIGGEEASRVAFPGGELAVVEGEQAQHVDDGGALDEVERAGGIDSPARGVEGEAAAIELRCGHCKRRTVQCRTTGNHGT